MAYKFNVIHDKVIIKPVERFQRTGSILRPDMGNDAPQIGEIVAIGPGSSFQFAQYVKTTYQIGDLVLIPRIGAIQFIIDNDVYYHCREVEILSGVIEVDDEIKEEIKTTPTNVY